MELSILGIGFLVGIVARVGSSFLPVNRREKEPVSMGGPYHLGEEAIKEIFRKKIAKQQLKAEPVISDQDFKTIMGLDPKQSWSNKEADKWPQLKNPIASEIPLEPPKKNVKISMVNRGGYHSPWIAYTVPDVDYLQIDDKWGKGQMAFFVTSEEITQKLKSLGIDWEFKQIKGY